MTDRITVNKTAPSTRFILEADLVSQSTAANQSIVRFYLKAVNTGNTTSHSDWTGFQAGSIDGIGEFGRRTGNPFLPSGVSSGAQRWRTGPYNVTVTHDANGYKTLTLRMTLKYNNGGVDESHTYSYELPRIPKVPSAPSITGTSNKSATSFRVNFTRGNNNGATITSEEAQWSKNAGFTDLHWTNAIGNGSYSDPSTAAPLSPSTQYWVRVRSKNSVGWSGWSNTITDTTDGHPTAPLSPSATASSTVTGRATVSWTVPSSTGSGGITGYTIYRNGVKVATTTGTGTTYIDNGLTPFTNYTYNIAARNAYSDSISSQGPVSSTASVLAQGPPTAPRDLIATPNPSVPGRVDLSWTAPFTSGTGGITGYRVRLSEGTLIVNQNGTGTTYSVTGLSPSLTYTFKVSARNALSDAEGSESAFSNHAVANPIGTPQAPTSFFATASPTVSNRLVLSWVAPAGTLTGYNIFRRQFGVDTLVGRVNSSHTTFTIDDLNPNFHYEYVVRARTAYTDGLPPSSPDYLGGYASVAALGFPSVNNTQTTPSLAAATSGTNAVFNGTYTVSGVTSTSFSYAKTNANIPTTGSGGSVTNNTNAVFNGAFTISATPTPNTFTYAKTNANIATLPTSGGTATNTTNQGFNGTFTVSSVNVGAQTVSYSNTGANVSSAVVPVNTPPGQTGKVTNLSNAIFNGTGKVITAVTPYTIKYAQVNANVAETNAAGTVTNTTNSGVFNGNYTILSIPSYDTVVYAKTSSNISTRTWNLPNGLAYRTTSPALLNIQYRSGWVG